MGKAEAMILREAYEAFGRGDERLFVGFLDQDFRYRARAELPGGGEFVGREVMDRRLAEWRQLFDEIRFENAEFTVSGDYILVALSWSGRGHSSGLEVSQDLFHLWRVRDGRGLELQVFSNRDQALAAARRPQ